MTLVDRIKALAARPQGMCSNDIDTHSTTSVGRACWRLGQAGELHQVRLAHKHVRWFADKTKADALQAKVDAPSWNHAARTMHPKSAHAQWPADAPAIETEHTVYTLCPRFVPRFQEHVFPFIHGGLRAAA